MFKVVLVLKTVVIRLKECNFDVVVRKKQTVICLASHRTISNGLCNVNHTSEFYVSEHDPTLHIQVILHLGQERKLGGDVHLPLLDWDSNVVHNHICNLSNSPDKQGRITFAFYYFQDSEVKDERILFLARDRHHSVYQ